VVVVLWITAYYIHGSELMKLILPFYVYSLTITLHTVIKRQFFLHYQYATSKLDGIHNF